VRVDSNSTSRPRPWASILAVDEDVESVEVMAQFLEREGFVVHVVTDPLAALDKAKEVKPDLIILEFFMPKLLGSELAIVLKSDPQLNAIPIVFHSAMADPDHRTIAEMSGAAAYLEKPSLGHELLGVIRRLLGGA